MSLQPYLPFVNDVAGFELLSFAPFQGFSMLSSVSQVFPYHLRLSLCRERFASELLGIRSLSSGSHI